MAEPKKQYEQKNRTGVLFSNKRRPADAAPGRGKPNATGYFMIDGQKCQVAAWTKTPKSGGDKFMSLTIEIPAGYKLLFVGEEAAEQPQEHVETEAGSQPESVAL